MPEVDESSDQTSEEGETESEWEWITSSGLARRLWAEMDIAVWLKVKKTSSRIPALFHLKDQLSWSVICGAGMGDGEKFWIYFKNGLKMRLSRRVEAETKGWCITLPPSTGCPAHCLTQSPPWHAAEWQKAHAGIWVNELYCLEVVCLFLSFRPAFGTFLKKRGLVHTNSRFSRAKQTLSAIGWGSACTPIYLSL